jgi:hypothetical protein
MLRPVMTGNGWSSVAGLGTTAGRRQARRAAEDRGHRAGVALQQPRLVVVVHGEHAVGPQVAAGLGDRLDGEQVALQAQGRLAGDDRERVGQGQHDQVVAAAGLLQERPAVVDVGRDPRVEVGAVGVAVTSQALQGRVDLDRVHVPGPVGQGHGHVVAGAGSDHQHLVQGPGRQVPVGEEVERRRRAQALDRAGDLVGAVCWPNPTGRGSRGSWPAGRSSSGRSGARCRPPSSGSGPARPGASGSRPAAGGGGRRAPGAATPAHAPRPPPPPSSEQRPPSYKGSHRPGQRAPPRGRRPRRLRPCDLGLACAPQRCSRCRAPRRWPSGC